MRKAFLIVCLPLLVFADDQTIDTEISPPRVSIVAGNGSTITLTDGIMYEIDPRDAEISSAWIGNSAEVIVVDTQSGSDYPILLTNKDTGATVHARIASSEEDITAPPEAPSENDDGDY